MFNVVVATPSYKNAVSTWYLRSILQYTHLMNVRTTLEFESGDSLVPRARNTLFTRYVNSYKAQEYTHLFWQDDDIFVTGEGLQTILNHGLDVVGVAYPFKRGDISHGIQCVTGGVYEEVSPLLYKARHIGTGAMLLSNKAVEAIVRFCEDTGRVYREEHGLVYDVFRVGATAGIYYSEDWFVCAILRELGFELYVDSSSLCVHADSNLYYSRDAIPVDKRAFTGLPRGPLPAEQQLTCWTPCDFNIDSTRL